MGKRVNHLIAIKAFTRQSLPMPMPKGTSLEEVVKGLYEKWEGERAGFLHIRSPIQFQTLLERLNPPKGIFPLIAQEQAALDSFAYYPSSRGTIEIRDTRGVILGYRFKIPLHLLATLNTSTKTLNASDSGGGGDRPAEGSYEGRHYSVWVGDGEKYGESGQLLRDGEKGREWLRENQELFDYCSNQLRFLCPEQWVAMTGRVVKDIAKVTGADGGKLKPLCGAWHGVSLNEVSVPASWYQNEMDDKRLFNCIAPFGDGFSGGDLVLRQMRMRIGLEIGDGFFFYGTTVAHQVMQVTAGVRNSIDLFTHPSNFALLAKHDEAAGRVKYPVKEQKLRGMKKREERRKANKNPAAGKGVRRGAKVAGGGCNGNVH